MGKRRNLLISTRIKRTKYILILSFSIVIIYLLYIMIIQKDFYSNQLDIASNKVYSLKEAPRGRIYDRNHVLLVDNKMVPVIYYINKNKNSSKKEIDLAYKISNILDIDYSKLTNKMLKDFYLVNNECNYLITDEEWNRYDYRELNSSDIYKLKLDRIDDSIFDSYSDLDREASYVYYLMNNGYFYELKTIKKDNLSDLELSSFIDNIEELDGFIIDYSYERYYPYGDTLKSILGNISNISIEDKDYYLNKGYSLSDVVGSSYLEKQYEEYLKGEKGTYYLDDLHIVSDGKRGKDIVLTIDIELQQRIDKILEEELIKAKAEPNTSLFNSIYVVIKDPSNGDILAISGKSIKKEDGKYKAYDNTLGVLNYGVTPGSVVKGASILVGYKENAIEIGEKMTDSCIKIYSYPKKCSWKSLGTINDIEALSYSSNIFQFKTAFKVANFDYSYNKKITDVEAAFNKYRAFFKEIGLGDKSGIDLPIEGIGTIGTSNSPDLYLNYVIGQYDSYTTMQLSEYISTIANDGIRVNPHLLLEVRNSDNKDGIGSLYLRYVPKSKELDIDKKYIERVQLGFIDVMENGLGKNFMGKVTNPAGKTGTSESFYDSSGDGVIDTPTLSNSFVGYYPSDNPKMSIAITFPNIAIEKENEARSYANKRITRRISETFFELYG